jgi:hypothetical protein
MNFRFKTILIILGCLKAVVGGEYEYQPYPEDLQECARLPLVSGVNLSPDETAITLAFNEKAKVRHAYLVFESKTYTGVNLRALHFGGTDCCFDYYRGRISLCAPNQAEVRVDDTPLVLSKCCRAIAQEYQETQHGRDPVGIPFHADPMYVKHSTFIVSSVDAARPWSRISGWKDGAGKIEFSLWGDVFSSRKHNCCSFVALCLREASLPISIPGWWARSPENLKYYSRKYAAQAPAGRVIVHDAT